MHYFFKLWVWLAVEKYPAWHIHHLNPTNIFGIDICENNEPLNFVEDLFEVKLFALKNLRVV